VSARAKRKKNYEKRVWLTVREMRPYADRLCDPSMGCSKTSNTKTFHREFFDQTRGLCITHVKVTGCAREVREPREMRAGMIT
jgi:hypothetical protein